MTELQFCDHVKEKLLKNGDKLQYLAAPTFKI